MRTLIMPEQSWALDDARDSEGGKVARSDDRASGQKPVAPEDVSLSYSYVRI